MGFSIVFLLVFETRWSYKYRYGKTKVTEELDTYVNSTLKQNDCIY